MSSDDDGLPSAPDLVEPIVGFRQWRLADGVLKSMFIAEDWRDAEQHARCCVGNHDPSTVPAHTCSCGIYAYYDLVPRTASAATRELVAGVVVMWGRVELHLTGMRAQHALLLALELPLTRGRKRREVVAVAESLGVPALPHRKLKDAAAELGRPLGRELRPTRAPGYPYEQIGILPTVPWSALAPERRRRYRRRIIPRG